jgi:predicted nuclease of predicted toxin-antitoxin system
MRFLLDENFPKAACSLLFSLSHEVFDFRDVGVEGSPDSEVIEMAVSRSAVILTTDRDFFHTLGQQFPDHLGIIVVALKKPTRDKIIQRLKWLLEHVPEESIAGRAFQLRDQAWQVYPPLESTTANKSEMATPRKPSE